MNKHLIKKTNLAPVIILYFLSPIAAEYLSGYQGQGIEDLFGLIISLLIIGPLYGAPAILIREFARRAGRGYPTILILSCACGFAQAGLIDQSLFFHEFFQIHFIGKNCIRLFLF